MLNSDLHTHSTASDGTLSPSALVTLAHQHNINRLALTDHDTLSGLAEAQKVAAELGMVFVSGVEISVTWRQQLLHIVGLNFDPNHAQLNQGLLKLQQIRKTRAEAIGQKLAKQGLGKVYPLVRAMSGNDHISRRHFAMALVELGVVSTMNSAFKGFLAKGKSAYVEANWADLHSAVQWIKRAGGVAVLAHPLAYKMKDRQLKKTLQAFKELGGDAIEVVQGTAKPHDIALLSRLAQQFGLLGSIGSDFHSPDQTWLAFGRLPALPQGIRFVLS